MPKINYGSGAYRRDNGNFAELRLVNMFVEAAPTSDGGVALLSRKGLSRSFTAGAGPIRGIFRADGAFSGDTFTVSGNTLYRETTSLGTITGSGAVSMATDGDELAIAAGSSLYRYDTTNGLDAVTFPDSANVRKVIFHDGLFIACADATHKWYWSSVLDADTWNALDFASAERKPDTLLDMGVINDTLWLFGTETIEPWANTGDADAPYQRFEQRIFDKGIHSTGCLVGLDNTFLFVGSDGMAYRLGEVPQRISEHGIEERIAGSTSVSAFGFVHEGHSFFCIRLDDATFAYDLATQQWCEFASYDHDNFRARCATMEGSTAYLGDSESGSVWTFDGHDDDGAALERLFTAAFPIRGGSVSIDNLIIEANVGWTDLLAGQGSDPVAEMRSSRDAGATWDDWEPSDLGEQGEYRTKTDWRALGMYDWPGAMFEFRVTDPIGLRISGVFVNEEGGGRSR